MSKKAILIGTGDIHERVINELHKNGINDVIVVTPEEVKERGLVISDDRIPIKATELPMHDVWVEKEEPKNYINGKTLPRKKRRNK